MSKEFNVLSLDTTAEVKSSKNTSPDSKKKEGNSLFDSMLSDLKKTEHEGKNSNSETKKDTSENKNSQLLDKNIIKSNYILNKKNIEKIPEESKNGLNSTIKQENIEKPELLEKGKISLNIKEESKKEKTNASTKSKDSQKEELKNLPNNNPTATKHSNENSAISFMDRMILEAGTKISDIKKTEKKTQDNKNDKDILIDNIKTTKNIKNEKKDIKEDAKSEIVELKENIKENKENIKDIKEEEKNKKEIVKADIKEEKSLFDSIVKDIKNIDEQSVKPVEVKKEYSINKKADEVVSKTPIKLENRDKKLVDEKNKNNSIEKVISNENIKTTNEVEVKNNKVDLNNKKSENINEEQKATIINKIPEKETILNNKEKIEEKIDLNPKNNESKLETKTEVKVEKNVEKVVIKNEKVATELSKIVTTKVDDKIVISKEEIEKLETVPKVEIQNKENNTGKKSLMDKLIDESRALSNKQTNDISQINSNSSEQYLKQTSEKSIDPLITNMYYSVRKNSLNKASIEKVAIGKKIASEATSIKDVERSADFLNLGMKDSSIGVKIEELEQHTKLNFLDKLAFTKSLTRQEVQFNTNEILSKEKTLTKNNVKQIETEVQMNVSTQNAMNIENRIIGARQQMGTMMSEVARNMYLNYKPPVTAFRINLTPGTLGSIAIVMKSDRNSGINISLNMSNAATLDSFVDNQASLRAALAKNFNSDANFSLDFNMQKQDGGNSDSKNNQNNQQSESNKDENTIIHNVTNDNKIDNNSNYM